MVFPPAIAGILVGAWALLNATPTHLNGTPIIEKPVIGVAPVGLITYSSEGYMSANLASTDPEDRPLSLRYPAREGDSDVEWAIVGKKNLNYAGNCSVEPWSTPTNGTLTHGPLSVANVPSWTGTNQTRNYRVTQEGDRTVLHLWVPYVELDRIANLFWYKLGPSPFS
ncbi:hypothetical protein CC80DRAFT_493803 [Byssothecium circinans]|uniref:Lipocalin-like domain-containing protein n=1 Tax=Byssothecium circinans TaxID=147558 RepID=A0A6A5TN29_9PLEO|nr:hypothetical protein CC80DRAFT_493803 [Byssothecium circinans]